MTIRLFYGEKSKIEHEYNQIKEIIGVIKEGLPKETIYILTNVLLSNGDADCIIITRKGPVILELKDYTGEIIGEENGEWYVRTDNGSELPLNQNLFQQLKTQRNDLHRKLGKIFEEHISRIEKEDLRKIAAWGYFNRGSFYSDWQIQKKVVPWFDIVTADSLLEKLAHINPGYTLEINDFDIIVENLKLTEWSPDPTESLPEEPSITPGPILAPTKPDIPVAEPLLPVPPKTGDPIIPPTKPYTPVTTFPLVNTEGFEPSEIIEIIAGMAPHGTAPVDGCTLFSIGNEEFIETVKSKFLTTRINQKSSAEKFVVGQFGSGKTHFVNQVSEEARKMNCVTSTVQLNRNVEVTSNYTIYREVARQIRSPRSKKRGTKSLLLACFASIEDLTRKQSGSNEETGRELLRDWIDNLESFDFELDAFGRVVRQAFDAHLKNDNEKFDAASQWLQGEFSSREISKMLGVSVYPRNELNLVASSVNLSLYQFVKLCGFQGTVVVFDEAEQGFNISKKKQAMLYSLLQSDLNSVINLKHGSALILYAIHSTTFQGITSFPAFQQRISHPYKFSKTHFSSPTIEINRPQNVSKEEILKELELIGTKLVNLIYQISGDGIQITREDTLARIPLLASRCVKEDITTSNRRAMVKGTCTLLMELIENGTLIPEDEISLKPEIPEDEV